MTTSKSITMDKLNWVPVRAALFTARILNSSVPPLKDTGGRF